MWHLDRHCPGADLFVCVVGLLTRRVRNNIRKLRFLHDEMTQQELADRTGVTRQTIAAIEKDRHSPSLETAFRIADVFGQPLQSVFRFDSE